MTDERLKSIVIVGGDAAGWMAAARLAVAAMPEHEAFIARCCKAPAAA